MQTGGVSTKKYTKPTTTAITRRRVTHKTTKKMCVYVSSHGNYMKPSENITVPNNIRLIQYTAPRSANVFTIHKYIMEKEHCKNVSKIDFYLVNTVTGKTYNYNYKKYVIEPGEKTSNLQLQFDNESNKPEKIQMVLYDDGSTWECTTGTSIKITLKEVLDVLSKKYMDSHPDKIIDVIQLSCRVGNIEYVNGKKTEVDYNDIDELTRDLDSFSIVKEKMPLSGLKSNDRYYLVINNHESAKKISKIIKLKTKIADENKRYIETQKRITRKSKFVKTKDIMHHLRKTTRQLMATHARSEKISELRKK